MDIIKYNKLVEALGKADKLLAEFQGGYSGQFLSAGEFRKVLSESVYRFKQGDDNELDRLRVWFLPTSCWDDFTGIHGQALANEISCLLLDKEGMIKLNHDWRQKTLEELEQDFRSTPEYDSHLVRRCHELRKLRLDNFTTEDLRIMIGQQISLDYLIPLALEVLDNDLFAEGNFYEGDLLANTLAIETSFWDRNKVYWLKLDALIRDRLDEIRSRKLDATNFDRSIHRSR